MPGTWRKRGPSQTCSMTVLTCLLRARLCKLKNIWALFAGKSSSSLTSEQSRQLELQTEPFQQFIPNFPPSGHCYPGGNPAPLGWEQIWRYGQGDKEILMELVHHLCFTPQCSRAGDEKWSPFSPAGNKRPFSPRKMKGRSRAGTSFHHSNRKMPASLMGDILPCTIIEKHKILRS